MLVIDLALSSAEQIANHELSGFDDLSVGIDFKTVINSRVRTSIFKTSLVSTTWSCYPKGGSAAAVVVVVIGRVMYGDGDAILSRC